MSQLQRSPNPHFGPDCPQLENIRSDPNSHQYWIKDCLPVFVDGNHQKGFLPGRTVHRRANFAGLWTVRQKLSGVVSKIQRSQNYGQSLRFQ